MSSKVVGNSTVKVEVDARIKGILERASKVGAKVDGLLKAGLVDEALELVVTKESLVIAFDTIATATATGLPLNRYSRFYKAVVVPLREGRLPSKVEDKENSISLVTLTPERGDEFKSRYASKDLSALYAANFLKPEVVRAIDYIRTTGIGKGKGLKNLPDEIKNPVLALIPDLVKKAVGLV